MKSSLNKLAFTIFLLTVFVRIQPAASQIFELKERNKALGQILAMSDEDLLSTLTLAESIKITPRSRLEQLLAMTDAEWLANLENPRRTIPDFIELAKAFKAQMYRVHATSQWLDKYPEENEPEQTYLSKLVLPKNGETKIIGDIHGVKGNIFGALGILFDENYTNDQMVLNSNTYVIFLGDYVDRGKDSIKTISTILLFFLKNPRNVFLLRGNHEKLDMNKAFGLYADLAQIEPNSDNQAIVLGLIRDIYSYLSAGMFLGYAISNKIRYQFLSHASIDTRYDYLEFLAFQHESLMQNGGLCLWNLHKQDFCNCQLIQDLRILNPALIPDMGIINAQYSYPCDSCFLNTDIDFQSNGSLLNTGMRGPNSLVVSPELLRLFAATINTDTTWNKCKFSLDGQIQGHQHTKAKLLLPESEWHENSMGCHFCKYETPSHEYPSNCWTNNLPANKTIVICNNNFTVFTIMSGKIFSTNKTRTTSLNYYPTVLSVSITNETWNFIAITNE